MSLYLCVHWCSSSAGQLDRSVRGDYSSPDRRPRYIRPPSTAPHTYISRYGDTVRGQSSRGDTTPACR